ncbi:MAG TPA: ABC transporter substrate-binding protein [Verrucomicrobiae bacterium]|nr:ABC transporter substrate-binding protein [Verrucomicrobiae bacterium]
MKILPIVFIYLIFCFTFFINPLYNSASVLSISPLKNSTGGNLDEIKFLRYSNDNVAYQEVSNGHLDAYLSHIPLQLINDAKKNPDIRVYNKDGASYGLLLNPSNNTQTFNPFSIREIRYALNFLIDRNYIVNDILKGFGTLLVEPYGPYSPEYPNVVDVVEPLKIKYDPQTASNLISESMKKAGAKVDSDGKWIYNNTPVVIKILIRNDDPVKKAFGDVVASELDQLGFTVVKDYGDLLKANQVVYGSNPMDLGWNVYTESFISNSFQRYDPGTVGQMYAPWVGSMPGFQNPSFSQYSNSTIDNLTKKLIFNNFTSEHERNVLLKKSELLGLEESIRLFFARSQDPYIASNKIKGLVNDYSSGIANEMSFINAKKNISNSNSNNNKSLSVGLTQIYQGAWNGVDGCKDFYCRIINDPVSDPAFLLNPYTGDPIPFRNNATEIVSNGPYGKMLVPKDAIVWNPYTHKWVNNGNVTKYALSKIQVRPLYSNWHNGMAMDKFDLLYPFYFQYQWATDTKNNDRMFDAEYASTTLPSLALIKGLKLNDDGTFDNYIDLWHFDKKQLPLSGSMWASEPWEITAATERLVADGKLAYSKTDSNIKQIEQLSMILPSHAELIKQELEKMKQEKYIPMALKGLISLDYALKRYNASIKWINMHHNAIIGNGPYYLDSFNPASGTIVLKKFYDSTYPFKEGFFSRFENTPKLSLGKINVPNIIKIGEPFEFNVTVDIKSDETHQFKENINYILFDRVGNVILHKFFNASDYSLGIHNRFDDISQIINQNSLTQIFKINANVTKSLSIGPAKLELFVSSKNSLRPVIYEYTLIAVPDK